MHLTDSELDMGSFVSHTIPSMSNGFLSDFLDERGFYPVNGSHKHLMAPRLFVRWLEHRRRDPSYNDAFVET